MTDFSKAITSLRRRSRRSKLVSYWIGWTLAISVVVAFGFVAMGVLKSNDPFASLTEQLKQSKSTSASKSKATYSPFPAAWIYKGGAPQDALFYDRIDQVLTESMGRTSSDLATWLHAYPIPDSKPAITSKFDPAKLTTELEPLLSSYERVSDVYLKIKQNENMNQRPQWEELISKVLLSIGVVGFVLYFLQTAVAFMRYYARLGELYDAQADALEASGGDVEQAYNFLEKFSPLGIDFGKAPATLYEKSLETIAEFAKTHNK